MKKLATLALALALCVSMTGCGKNNKEAIKNAVDSYFTAMQAGDVQALSASCEEGYSDEMGLVDFEKNLDESFGGDEMGEVFQTEAKDFFKNVVGKVIKEYTLVSAEEKDGEAYAVVNIKQLDFDSIDFSTASEEFALLGQTYALEHMDELLEVMQNEGEAAMQQKLTDALAPQLFDKMEEIVAAAPYVDTTLKVTVVDHGDKWLISGVYEQ